MITKLMDFFSGFIGQNYNFNPTWSFWDKLLLFIVCYLLSVISYLLLIIYHTLFIISFWYRMSSNKSTWSKPSNLSRWIMLKLLVEPTSVTIITVLETRCISLLTLFISNSLYSYVFYIPYSSFLCSFIIRSLYSYFLL